VDDLPRILRYKAGAAVTFAQRALEAIKAKAGSWRQVDWEAVGKAAMQESVREHRQPPAEAYEAVLRHSPAHADKSPEQVKTMVEIARKQFPDPDKRPERDRDRGFER
jgi:hypothetical protein